MAYTHELTDIEIACGITLEQVADELPKGSFFGARGEELFMVPDNIGPALAGSVARAAFAGPAHYVGMTNGYPCYKAGE